MNLRPFNSLFPKPPSFTLPNFNNLLSLSNFRRLYFVKLDICNCYWSIRLPPFITGCFSGRLHGSYFTTTCLPFGWSWAPFLAQSTVAHFLSPLAPFTRLLWQYLDDVLIASEDPVFLVYLAYYAMYLLQSAGFILHLSKCVLTPTQTITWLGRVISAASGHISTLPSQAAAVLQQVAFLRYVRLNHRPLQQLLGSLQWLGGPASIVAPLLATAYSLLSKKTLPHRLPAPITYSLICASISSLLPATPRPLPPPLTMTYIFTDAAPVPSTTTSQSFKVASVKPRSYATSTYAPPWVRDQQAAELYGIFHGIRQAILRKYTYLCVITDSRSAYYSLLTGKVSATSRARLRTLRRINRLVHQHSCKLQVMWVPSSSNLADPYSRSTNSLYQSSRPVLQYTSTCATILRYWWHS
jgi:hypothetical protein